MICPDAEPWAASTEPIAGPTERWPSRIADTGMCAGVRCEHAESGPLAAGPSGASREWSQKGRDVESNGRSSRVYVYDLPEGLNGECEAIMRQWNWMGDMGFEEWPAKVPGEMANFGYAIEPIIHAALLNSPYRTRDPAAADWFYIPFYAFCSFRESRFVPQVDVGPTAHEERLSLLHTWLTTADIPAQYYGIKPHALTVGGGDESDAVGAALFARAMMFTFDVYLCQPSASLPGHSSVVDTASAGQIQRSHPCTNCVECFHAWETPLNVCASLRAHVRFASRTCPAMDGGGCTRVCLLLACFDRSCITSCACCLCEFVAVWNSDPAIGIPGSKTCQASQRTWRFLTLQNQA